MKHCPTCNRTYSDETISFCLADGSLLSAPYDRSKDDGPPTEVIPPFTRMAVPPTQAAKAPVPTITSFPVHHDFAPTKNDAFRPVSNLRAVFWTVAALVAVAIILGIVLVLRHRPNDGNESVIASNPQVTPIGTNNVPSPSTSPSLGTSKDPIVTAPSASSTPLEKKKAETLQADPALFPTDPKQQATPTASPAIDYSAIFSGSGVDSRVRILDKPEPTYTEVARKNQITGTIVIRAVFSAGGQVTNLHAVNSLPDGLTERAIEAARKIRFVPAMKNGRPVSMWMELQYNFNLY